ncbi:MAG TPA: alpha-L-fucosidase, partial [Phycisphaerae bacterium]|nr:alpha-L-fucosidase [Phycisphaerae bacterium]
MPGKPLDPVRRMRWFKEARFGMFVHWGLYSLIGRHEWVMNTEHMAINEYEKLAKQWRPRPDAPREWARLARNAGMRYMVLTAKHHDGFCLFDSEL